jgi:hypothetical protein
MRYVSVLFSLAFTFGCATGYQAQGFTGGFAETQLRQDIFRVAFEGNAYTSAERAADFTLLRSAELVQENGYKYFVIIDEAQSIETSTYTSPTTTNTTANVYGSGNYATGTATSTTYGGQTYHYQKPRSSNTILMLHDQDAVSGIAYEASFIIQSLREKYNLQQIGSR